MGCFVLIITRPGRQFPVVAIAVARRFLGASAVIAVLGAELTVGRLGRLVERSERLAGLVRVAVMDGGDLLLLVIILMAL